MGNMTESKGRKSCIMMTVITVMIKASIYCVPGTVLSITCILDSILTYTL